MVRCWFPTTGTARSIALPTASRRWRRSKIRNNMTENLDSSLRANGSRECAPDDRLREAIHGARKGGLLRRFAPKNDERVKALIFPSFFFAFQAALAMGCKVTSKPSLAIWFTNRFTLISGGRWSK